MPGATGSAKRKPKSKGTLPPKKRKQWYASAQRFWESCDPTDQSMLGGYEHTKDLDVETSFKFLKDHGPFKNGLDLGAGIGRVTRDLLVERLNIPHVHIVELSEKLIKKCEKINAELPNAKKLCFRHHCCSITDYEWGQPCCNTYDFMLLQYVMGHLLDDDLAEVLKKASDHLEPGRGIVFVKENMSNGKNPYRGLDSDSNKDFASSFHVRSESSYNALFHKAELEVVSEMWQEHMPEELMPVKMLILRKQKSVCPASES
eukprot:Clim_evm19s240 gene=Clim_evmTU19s240